MAEKPASAGRVILVGAGPGDPELLTLKAVRALKSADVILYDSLVGDGILDYARREATIISVGKRGGKPSAKQAEIHAQMIAHARWVRREQPLFGRVADGLGLCGHFFRGPARLPRALALDGPSPRHPSAAGDQMLSRQGARFM